LIKPNEELPDIHLSSEDQFFMTQEEYPIKDISFEDYTNATNRFEEDSLDFILIDGRARKSCALNAIDKLKIGGIIILDNSERKRYEKVHQTFAKYPSIQTTTGLTDTTIWLKT
jgi:predicted O-methyltransferase YrrM